MGLSFLGERNLWIQNHPKEREMDWYPLLLQLQYIRHIQEPNEFKDRFLFPLDQHLTILQSGLHFTDDVLLLIDSLRPYKPNVFKELWLCTLFALTQHLTSLPFSLQFSDELLLILCIDSFRLLSTSLSCLSQELAIMLFIFQMILYIDSFIQSFFIFVFFFIASWTWCR